jgi:hypothetical protein
MAGKGGYQPPRHPAPVSGPGALSRRTDQPVANLTDAQYGEASTFRAQQQGAPLSATPQTAAQPSAAEQLAQRFVGLDQPSTHPGEPVTAGAPSGPGPGPEVLASGLSPQASYGTLTSTLQGLAASDSTGAMAALLRKAMELGLQ